MGILAKRSHLGLMGMKGLIGVQLKMRTNGHKIEVIIFFFFFDFLSVLKLCVCACHSPKYFDPVDELFFINFAKFPSKNFVPILNRRIVLVESYLTFFFGMVASL